LSLFKINPLVDTRWDEFIGNDPRSSVFHRREWLEALARTYNYQPFALTSASTTERITDGAVFCYVSSWITGNRAVALPFADHCELLTGPCFTVGELQEWFEVECEREHLRYIEVRPTSSIAQKAGLYCSESYWLHVLDMTPSTGTLYSQLHKNSFQRKIKKAEREGLRCEVGNSDNFLNHFYALMLKTRRRHQLVPQPKAWFKNLIDLFGSAIQIRVVRKARAPIAAILTLQHGSRVYYKYGASDTNFHHLGAMPLLFWTLIEESKAKNLAEVDLGRSDQDQPGLITFKDRLGAKKRLLQYYRYSKAQEAVYKKSWRMSAAKAIFSILPDFISPSVGSILYRHIG
jgi:Acetyltransferase (GNAT) domain